MSLKVPRTFSVRPAAVRPASVRQAPVRQAPIHRAAARPQARSVARLLPVLLVLVGAWLLSTAAASTTVTFWHTYSTDSKELATLTDVVIPKFEADHPDITVKATAFPYGEFRQKLLTAFAGGDVPDVVRMDIIWVPEFADMGALERIDGLDGFAALKDAVFPGPLATNAWNGGYFGLPLDTNTQVFLYNEDAVSAAGLTPPATFADFQAFARKLTDAGKETYGYALPGPWAWYFLPWIWSNGGAITDPAITKASGYLNSPATVEAVQMLVDLYKEGALAPTIAQSGLGSWEGMGNASYASTQDGPWTIPALTAQYSDLHLGLALMPAGKAGSVSIVGGEDIVMMGDSKHKDAAWAFTQFMLSPWAQATMAKTGQMPVLASAAADPAVLDANPYFATFLEQLKTAKPRTPHPAYSQMEEIMQTAFQKAVAGDATVQAAFDDAAQQIDALLAQ